MSISDELGQSCVRSQSLLFPMRLGSRVLKKSLMSLSTKECPTSWSLSSFVIGWSAGRRNPERIWTSGWPVMKNLTLGILSTCLESTNKIAALFKLQAYIHPCSPQAPLPVPRTVPSPTGMSHASQKDVVYIFLSAGYYTQPDSKGVRLTMSWQLLS